MDFVQTPDNIIKTSSFLVKPTESIGKVLFKHLIQHQDKIAQIDAETDEQRTYGDILQRSVRTTLHMKDMGIEKNDVITVCAENHIDAVLPFIAAQFLGAKTANIDPSFSPSEMIYLLNIAQPKIIFATPQSKEILISIMEKMSLKTKIVVFGRSNLSLEFSEFIAPHADENDFKPIEILDLKETAMIYFSSGTTGLPKAICINHYSCLGQLFIDELRENVDMEIFESIRTRMHSLVINLCYTSMYWISAGINFLRTLIYGFCCLVVKRFDGEKIWSLLKKHRISFLILTPVQTIEMFANKPQNQIGDWKHLILLMVVGSSLAKKHFLMVQKEFPETFVYSGYGQTEIFGPVTTFNYVNKHHRTLMHKPEKIDSVGLPVRGINYKVVNLETNKNVGPNQEGELRLQTELVMNGYHKADSSDAFDEDGWLRTGDIVYYDEDYCFYIVDRIKEAFKYQGWFIAPSAIEEVLLSHPAVKLAAVIGIPKEDGHYPLGIIVLKDNCNASEKEIVQFVEERVPDRQRLRGGVQFIQEMPLTVSGKINRSVLKQRVLIEKL